MKKGDFNEYILLVTVGILLIIGIIIISSVSAIQSQDNFGTPYHYLTRHILHIVIGIIAGIIAFKIKLSFLKKWSVLFLGFNFLLLLLLIPFGFSAGGATRWIIIGPFMAQPSEFLKLTLIIFLAAWFEKVADFYSFKRKKSKQIPVEIKRSILIPVLFFLTSTGLVVIQPDLGTSVLIFSVFIVMYFATGTPLWHTITIATIGLSAIIILIKIAPYRFDRLTTFLNPDYDPMGIGYQIKQIFIAIGSGGIFGLGLGMSRQKMGFLPETMTDTIFATFAEEAGFLGSILIVFFFMLFLWSGINIIKKTNNNFGSLMATGITSWIVIQAFINIGAMVGIMPLTGIPLPFISYGGSHLITELTAVGLLLNISRNKNL